MRPRTRILTLTFPSLRRPCPYAVPIHSAIPHSHRPRLQSHHIRPLITTTSAPTIKQTDIAAPHCGHIRILSLNRPQARNAISRQLLTELHRHVMDIYDEGDAGDACGTRVLILASESDEAFCAGADLKERKGWSGEETATFLTSLRHTFNLLSHLPIPSISCISSLALGGGLELALCTSLRVFSSTAIVGLPETRLGIIPGAGGTYRLPELIGLGKARDLIFTGRRVGGVEAWRLGLCERLVDVSSPPLTKTIAAEGEAHGVDGNGNAGKYGMMAKSAARQKVLQAAIDLANEICQGGPVAIRKAVESLEGWRRGEGKEGESESSAYEGVVGTEDRNEALRAFGEKRKPVFRGR